MYMPSCVLSTTVLLFPPNLLELLFHLSAGMLIGDNKGQKKRRFETEMATGEIETRLEEASLGTMGGIKFMATVEMSNGRTAKVTFIVRTQYLVEALVGDAIWTRFGAGSYEDQHDVDLEDEAPPVFHHSSGGLLN